MRPDEGKPMRYSSLTNAWAFARPKDAALYFDKAHILSDYLVEDRDEGEALLERNGKPAHVGGKATFGRIVNVLVSSRAFHIPELETDLKGYIALRNDLVHEVVGTSLEFDFEHFFALGERIIARLKPHFVETLARAHSREASKSNA